ncbi:PEP-CTERM motif-containing protein [Duganella sp. CF402]|uniref:MHFG family PEP-CTERM protein n=1 Tax=unclassified Duganella TaxID=2636909 RepID=UPI0008AEBA00|nr:MULTISPECIES: MHFG family PEP-CTERM protein [unclassified Duganella]RZT10130.1 PEP-CTERM motif-containing protein [Duganella sp. BK701]SEL26969.1 PEP-CTERM motif-containing protein [Duganella sp. CF402]
MPVLLAVTLAAALQPACSWDNPGHNPYTGGAAAAIDRYTDIPEAVRSTLKRRLAEGQSDDKVNITRDGIAGKYQYDPAIRDMHFGRASVCRTVTRDRWAATRSEPGAVYCVGEHCILVPRICGNVSRISRTAPAVAAAPKEEAREMEQPLAFADLGLADAPERGEMPLDEAEEAERRASHQRAQDTVAELLDEAELEATASNSRFRRLGGDGAFTDDDIGRDVSPVPEADTWAMLLAGLGLVGWQVRRSRRQAR